MLLLLSLFMRMRSTVANIELAVPRLTMVVAVSRFRAAMEIFVGS
jgi:hypothetical protein